MVTPRLMPDFREFLSLLSARKIEYLLVGGYAVALHGYVRPTKDLDLWISTKTDNLVALIDALKAFGFTATELSPEQFTGVHTVFRMGLPPNRLELLTAIDGVAFDDCYGRRISMKLDDIDVYVIGLEDLRTNKLASPRLKDHADVEQLDKLRKV